MLEDPYTKNKNNNRKKKTTTSYLEAVREINSKLVTKLNVKFETIKFLRENTGGSFSAIKLAKISDITPKE